MAAGSLLGGVLIELFGAQSMFLILVATTLAVLLIFIVAQKVGMNYVPTVRPKLSMPFVGMCFNSLKIVNINMLV